MNELEHKRRTGLTSEAEVAGMLLGVAKPQPDTVRDTALLDRIMAVAERTPRLVAVSAEPKVLTLAPTTPVANPIILARLRPVPRRDLWAAASVLAASLLIGFVAGQTSLPSATVFSVAEASGVSVLSATQDVATLLAGAELGDDD